MKLDKLKILKLLFKKIPIPDIEDPILEDLKYSESRTLYKLMVCVDYCLRVEDRAARIAMGHKDKEALDDYRVMLKKGMKFLIHLTEADSFYRFRVSYLLWFLKSDIFREIFFHNLRDLGFDKEWKESDPVADMKIETYREDKTLFSHLPLENRKTIKKEEF